MLTLRGSTMKKLLIALAGAACLFTQLPAKADQLQDIEKRGTIRIAVPQDFPPFGSVGTDLQPQGYDIDMARYLAKNIVAAELADRCEIELAYAIGLADPVSVMVDTFGTGRVSDEKIASWLMEHIDMRPGSITSRFELRRPIYRRVSCGGHFGENAVGLPWEWTDIAEVLQKEILS